MKPGITVTASGEASAPPDRCLLTVGASGVAANVAGAMSLVNEKVNGLLAVLADHGIAREAIQTTDLTVWPEHDREGTQTGFRVRNLVRVEVSDLSRVGTIVTAASEALGDTAELQGIAFDLVDTAPVEAEARARAWSNVVAKAEQLANHAGARLGSVLSVVDPGGGPGPQPRGRMMAMAEATPVEAGSSVIRVQLTVRFALAG